MPAPAHWRWRDAPVDGGPAVIVDIDGVLADATPGQPFLRDPARVDWRRFFQAIGDEKPVDEVCRLVGLLDPGLTVVLVTARPTAVSDFSVDWLARHGVRWDLLVMRPAGDYMAGATVKRLAVRQLREVDFDLRLAFDDDRRNVDMFHAEGVPCIYIHSGYYG